MFQDNSAKLRAPGRAAGAAGLAFPLKAQRGTNEAHMGVHTGVYRGGAHGGYTEARHGGTDGPARKEGIQRHVRHKDTRGIHGHTEGEHKGHTGHNREM